MGVEVTKYARGTEVRYGYAWQRGYGEIGGRAIAPDGRVRTYTANHLGDATIKVRGITVPGVIAYEFDYDADKRYLVFSTDVWPEDGLPPVPVHDHHPELYRRLAEALGTRSAAPLDRSAVCAVRLDGGALGVRYHSTVIVRVEPTGDVILDNGGWYTRTTLDHMNAWTPSEYSIAGMCEPHYSKSSNPRRYWTVSRNGEPIFDDFAEDFRRVVLPFDRVIAHAA